MRSSTAEATGADAIVVALNPAWVRTEWSLRGWPNLDVSNLGTLWSQPSSWSWALALTGPDDYAWRMSRAAFPLVEAQTRLNEYARDKVDAIDVLERPEPRRRSRSTPATRGSHPARDMWLVDPYGPDVLADEDTRVASLIAGIGVPQDEARYFASLLLDEVEDADVPVFLYATPFSPESLAQPGLRRPRPRGRGLLGELRRRDRQ